MYHHESLYATGTLRIRYRNPEEPPSHSDLEEREEQLFLILLLPPNMKKNETSEGKDVDMMGE